MKRSVSTSVIVVVLVGLVVVIGAGVAVTATDLSPKGLTVDGHTISQRDIEDDLDSIAHSGQLDQNAPGAQTTKGSVSGAVSAGWLTRLVQTRVILGELRRQGITLTDAARAKLEKSAGGQLDGLSDGVKRTLLDYNLGLQKLQDKLGQDGVGTALNRALQRAKVSIDPRYGRWNRQQRVVCAPSGCPPPSTGG
jgi:hypothetical protein